MSRSLVRHSFARHASILDGKLRRRTLIQMKISSTKTGLRLSQHGVVISEMRTSPGPTHSVFDVLASLIVILKPTGRVGVMGFAGGGMMAPLRALGCSSTIHSVDLDRSGFDLFHKHCSSWAGPVDWSHSDAAEWLRQQPRTFDLLMDDLSIPENGDVFKPSISWGTLPKLIRARLQPDGIAVFNLLKPPQGSWDSHLQKITAEFGMALVIHLDRFENRILIAGRNLPSARALGSSVRTHLAKLRSTQAKEIHIRSYTPKVG